MNDERLTQRLREASNAIDMSDSAQARHLEAIAAALPGQADDAVVPIGGAGRDRRRRFVASVAAAALIAPAGLAAASEGTVPGDTLYPVKQLSERVLVLFDSEVIARHRIEELEALDGVGNAHPGLVDDAHAALTELGEGHPLWDRLAATSASNGRSGPVVDDDDQSEAPPATRVDVRLPDDATAVLMIADGELVDVAAPPGWTVTDLDDDGATLVSDTFEVELEVRGDGSVETDNTRLDDDDSDPSKPVTGPDDDSDAEPDTMTGVDHDDDSDDDDASDGGTSDDDASSDD